MKMKKLMRFFKEEDGATAVEYGIMVAAIAAVVIVAAGVLGGNTSDILDWVAARVVPPAG